MMWLVVFCITLTIYTICCNFCLIGRYNNMLEERNAALADLAKLKLLNKLKTDWDGNPIRYEDFK